MTIRRKRRYRDDHDDWDDDLDERHAKRKRGNHALVIGLIVGGVLLLIFLSGLVGLMHLASFPGGTHPDELVGSWKGRFFLRGQELDIVYTFDKSGHFREEDFDLQGRRIISSDGRWRLRDDHIEVRFGLLGGLEKGNFAFLDNNTIKYRIVDHSEAAQIGLETIFRRQSAQDPPANARPVAPAKAPTKAPPTGRPAPPATGWTVLFRSDDPSIWNTDVNDNANRFARSLASIPIERVRYLRIVEARSNQFVIISISRDKLAELMDGPRYGWEGTNHTNSGAYHLGIFDNKLPATQRGDVCIRILPWFAGWGFGHLHFDANKQGYCWAGRTIAKTTFEIAVSPGPLTDLESASHLEKVQ
jgi:hypothetical protein